MLLKCWVASLLCFGLSRIVWTWKYGGHRFQNCLLLHWLNRIQGYFFCQHLWSEVDFSDSIWDFGFPSRKRRKSLISFDWTGLTSSSRVRLDGDLHRWPCKWGSRWRFRRSVVCLWWWCPRSSPAHNRFPLSLGCWSSSWFPFSRGRSWTWTSPGISQRQRRRTLARPPKTSGSGRQRWTRWTEFVLRWVSSRGWRLCLGPGWLRARRWRCNRFSKYSTSDSYYSPWSSSWSWSPCRHRPPAHTPIGSSWSTTPSGSGYRLTASPVLDPSRSSSTPRNRRWLPWPSRTSTYPWWHSCSSSIPFSESTTCSRSESSMSISSSGRLSTHLCFLRPHRSLLLDARFAGSLGGWCLLVPLPLLRDKQYLLAWASPTRCRGTSRCLCHPCTLELLSCWCCDRSSPWSGRSTILWRWRWTGVAPTRRCTSRFWMARNRGSRWWRWGRKWGRGWQGGWWHRWLAGIPWTWCCVPWCGFSCWAGRSRTGRCRWGSPSSASSRCYPGWFSGFP